MWQVGDIISGDYQILNILGGPGKSGMGIVYVCYNRKSRLPVAIKTFQDQYFSNNFARERFRWEAEAWIKLEQHHNIVRAFFVRNIEGRPFVFMEYIVGDERYGVDLGGWINRRGLWKGEKPDLPLIVNFSIQFCHGMMHAEKKFRDMGKPFVHRDIKPQNILITQNRVVKVTDFGLVKTFSELTDNIQLESTAEGPNTRYGFTKMGNICGTPPYVSPEQCLGVKEIDARADIYAFGCILYEMLTSRHPFRTRLAQEFIYHHLHTRPDPPDVQDDIDLVVMKCLEKTPAGRYHDFGELEENLANI